MAIYCYHYLREIVKTPNGHIVLIDVCKTPDYGRESAYALFDEETFRRWWGEEGNTPYTFEDILAWGEDSNAFYNWTIISSGHRNPEIAERNLRKFIATL